MTYNQRILETSESAQRRYRAARMVGQPGAGTRAAERLAKIAAAAPPASSFEGRVQQWRDAADGDEEFEVVFSGKDSLSKFVKDTA